MPRRPRKSPRTKKKFLKKPLKSPEPAPPAERLQKLLAAAGLGSRRQIEEWIAAGRVTVNGRLAVLGSKASSSDSIEVDGKPVTLASKGKTRVLLYHKPVGELVTRSDPEGRATVFSRLPPGRWVNVGRLDLNSSGLLLFTDDGELANRLMHPRYEVQREYSARIRGALSREETDRLLKGVPLDDDLARFERIHPQEKSEGTNRWYRVVLREGRNREVRRLFEAVGHPVSRLIRIRYGPVELPRDLAPGEWREMRNPVILQKL